MVKLGEDLGTTNCHRAHRKVHMIPPVDSITDSTDSLSQTLDSVDLTESLVKHAKAKQHERSKDTDSNDTDEANENIETNDKDKGQQNIFSNDKDEDEQIDLNKAKIPKIYTKDRREKIDSKQNDEDISDKEQGTPIKTNKGKASKI